MKKIKINNQIVKILGMIVVLFLVSVISFIILNLAGIMYYDDGFKLNTELFLSFSTTWYGCIVIILIQVVITSLLSFIPGTSMAFIILLQVLYNNHWIAFAVAFMGVLLSSMVMYIIGRYGGYGVCKKIIGKEDCDKASKLLNDKGNIYFPIMMLFPIFPDDALIMIAGTLKMSLKWFIPSILFGRGIGVATIIFGISIVPFDKFKTVWHWIVFILICLLLVIFVFFLGNKVNKLIEKKKSIQNMK